MGIVLMGSGANATGGLSNTVADPYRKKPSFIGVVHGYNGNIDQADFP
ncbi:hypothetical protein QFZ34_001168 [Phyllobacterium ifriqiyense]|uniref:Uncharacterized protein n=1 Tax=Phyllobacterium ifriqiyense TaxID=314238 RepID=A0ABU0S642_9HYPH|nr:hypothetical protein [Phyllobacterium ifriqiyense]